MARILVVTTSYPRFDGDHAGNFVAGHVEALRALGHEVEVIAAGPTEHAASHASPTTSHASPTTSHASEPSITRIPSSLFFRGGAPDLIEARGVRALVDAARFTTRLAIEVRRRRPDQIIAHWLAPSAIAALPSNIPLLAIAHGGDVHLLRRTRLLAPTLYALRARGARLAFVSDDLRAIACAAAPGLARWLAGAIVQTMGIDVARFGALERQPTSPPTILIASRLVPVKGIDVAIAALAHLRAPARVVIAGDGPDRAALQAFAERVMRASSAPASSAPSSASAVQIEFLGEVPADERDRLLSLASLVVIPSRVLANGRTEGTPLIALEALAAGVPVVASAVGGLTALPVHRVRPEDPRALASAIDQVLATPGNPAQLRELAGAFTWARVARVLS